MITLIILFSFGNSSIFAATLSFPEASRSLPGEPRSEDQLVLAPDTYVSDELIVKFQSSLDIMSEVGRQTITEFAASHGLELVEILNTGDNTARFNLGDRAGIVAKIRELKTASEVLFSQPNYRYTLQNISTNDEHRGLLWALDNTGQTVNGIAGTSDADVDAPEAWSLSEGSNSQVVVAVLDNGVAYNHPDLRPNMWDGSS
ncbi:MAG: hypothetical protein WAU88_06835 [Candidatus Zixiibacteriota bacterium]